jgi:hypothetical protein
MKILSMEDMHNNRRKKTRQGAECAVKAHSGSEKCAVRTYLAENKEQRE